METMTRRLPTPWTAVLWAGITLCLGGCAGTTGGTFTLFPAGHQLLDSTKQLRAVAPMPAPLPRELAKTVLDVYLVEPGDVLLIEPEDFDSPIRFPGDQTVLADGTIDLQKYGRPVVAGRSLEEIEAIVAEAVKKEVADAGAINVRLVNPQSKHYYVLGEVNAPGAFPLIGRETALDAIVAAGGLSNRAEPCKIILSRPTQPDGCRIVLPICYQQIVQLGDTSTNYQIMPGDRIYVASRSMLHDLFPFLKKKECGLCMKAHCACFEYGCAEGSCGIPTSVGPVNAVAEPAHLEEASHAAPMLKPVENE